MKNLCSKTVKPENAYEIWSSNGWTWYVLKKYQTPEKEKENSYARWYCFVTSPFCPEGEYGDCYVVDIINNAKKIK